MKSLVSKAARRLGIPGRPALIISPGERVPVGKKQIESMQRNSTVSRWLQHGLLVIVDSDGKELEPPKRVRPPSTGLTRSKDDKRTETPLPEGLTGEGAEMLHTGSGWWQVYVNGFQVTTKKVRKEEAESIAAEY